MRSMFKRVNIASSLGMIAGLTFGVVWIYLYRGELSLLSPTTSYRFGALIPAVGFPTTTALIGILIGKFVEMLVGKMKDPTLRVRRRPHRGN